MSVRRQFGGLASARPFAANLPESIARSQNWQARTAPVVLEPETSTIMEAAVE
jgi:hypothetical protein